MNMRLPKMPSVAFIGLSRYTALKRSGLYKSSQLSDATETGVSALEEMKAELSDSANFVSMHADAEKGPVRMTRNRNVNSVPFAIDISVTQGPAQENILKIMANSVWSENHSVTLGVLFPGTAAGI